MLFKRLYTFLFVNDLLELLPASVPAKAEPPNKKVTRDLSCLLLFGYVLLILNPVMPIIADKIAHTFYEKQHLLTVHQVKGIRHVHIELGKTAKQCDKEKSGKSGQERCTHVLSITKFNFSSFKLISKSYAAYVVSHPTDFTDVNYQPPRA